MPRSRARRTTAVASVTLGAVALLAAGAVGALVLGPQRTPASLTSTAGPTLVDVAREAFDDKRQVAVAAEQSTGVTLSVRAQGLVTRTTCAPGLVVASGSSPLTVDDQRVVALHTSEPLWRDLGPGAKGTDVQALQTELARLGHAVRPDGVYGRSTAAAVKALHRSLGTPTPPDSLTATSVMWLPAPEVTVETCHATLASSLADGKVATTASTVTALTLTEAVDGAVPGDRVVRMQGVQAPVDAEGRVTDPTLLAAFAASPEWRFAQSGLGDEAQGGQAPQVKVDYALATPVDALVVPPGALYALAGDQACMAGETGPVAVRVVSSALGKSMVVAEGDAPARVQVPPLDDAPCR